MAGQIIGIVGLIGSGKDTIADYLVTQHNFTRESFASSLKDAVSDIFSWDRELLDGRTEESRAWREVVDPWWAERLNIPHLTPRWVLQNFGTEACRKHFADDIWIASLENKLRQRTDDVVISDVRFPNEVKALRKQGGKIIRVRRGPEPEWFNIAIDANRHNDPKKIEELGKYGIHSSETAWIGLSFDNVFFNDGTIEQLCIEVRKYLALPLPTHCLETAAQQHSYDTQS